MPGERKVAEHIWSWESFCQEAGFLGPVRVLSPSGRTHLQTSVWTGSWEDISWRVELLVVSVDLRFCRHPHPKCVLHSLNDLRWCPSSRTRTDDGEGQQPQWDERERAALVLRSFQVSCANREPTDQGRHLKCLLRCWFPVSHGFRELFCQFSVLPCFLEEYTVHP